MQRNSEPARGREEAAGLRIETMSQWLHYTQLSDFLGVEFGAQKLGLIQSWGSTAEGEWSERSEKLLKDQTKARWRKKQNQKKV